MTSVYLVHPGRVGLAREAGDRLAASLREAGHEVACAWRELGRGPGLVRTCERSAAAADHVVVIDPARWWRELATTEPWVGALQRRIEQARAIGIEPFVIVEDRRGGTVALDEALRGIPRFELPERLTALRERLEQPFVGAGLPLDQGAAPLPDDHVASAAMLAALDTAIAKAGDAGVVWIRGGPGTGKSTLLAEFIAARPDAATGTPWPCHVAQRGIEWTLDPEAIETKLACLALADEHAWSRTREQALAGLRERLARREAPVIVALDGVEQIVASLERGQLERWRERLADGIARNLVIVAVGRRLPPPLDELEPAIELDLDREPWPDERPRIVAALAARAGLEPHAERIIIAAAADNLAIARALIEVQRGREQEPSKAELALPRDVAVGLEHDWAGMLARAGGQRRSLVRALELLGAGGGSLPRALFEVALTEAMRAALLAHASEWLTITDEAVGVHHPAVVEFLSAELGLDDPAAHRRLTLALEQLRRAAALDGAAARYADRRARTHELGFLGLDADVAWALDVGELVRFAGDGTLELKLEAVLPGVTTSMRPLVQRLLTIVRRRCVAIRDEPSTLPSWLWFELVAGGVAVAEVHEAFTWRPALPPIRLLAGLTCVDASFRVLGPHQGKIYGCGLGAAGARAVTVTDDRELRAWSVRRGELLGVLELDGWADACGVTHDGTRAAVAVRDTVVLVDLDRMRVIDQHHDHGASVEALAIDPRGKLVVSGDRDGDVIAWWIEAGRRVLLGSHGDRVSSCAVSSDATLALTGGEDKHARVWDLDRGEPLHELGGHEYGVGAVALSADGERGVTIGIGDARVWKPRTGELVASYANRGMGTCGCILVNGDTEVLAGESGERVTRWAVADGELITRHAAHGSNIESIAATADGELYLTGGYDRLARVWRREDVADLDRGYLYELGVVHPAADGRSVWIADAGQGVRRLRLDELGEDVPYEGQGTPMGVAERDGLLVTVGTGRQVTVYTLDGDGEPVSWQPDDEWLRACAFTPDGDRIVYGGDAKILYCSRLDGSDRTRTRGHSAWIYGLAFTPDGRLVSIDSDSVVRIWDFEARSCLHEIELGHAASYVLTLDEAGRRAFVGGTSSTIDVIDLDRGARLDPIAGAGGSVRGLALVAHDRLLISTGTDACLRIWDVETRALLARLDTCWGLTQVAVVGRRDPKVVAGDLAGNHLVFEVDWERLSPQHGAGLAGDG